MSSPGPRRGHATRGGRWLTLSILIVVVLVVAHALWLPAIGRFLVVSDPLQAADAILPLGGAGRTRTQAAAELYRQGLAPWFVVTDMPINTPGIRETYGELMRREAAWQGAPEERIVIASGTHRTTYSEARALRQLMTERGWRTLIVVTDPYHTRRARMCFRDVFRGTDLQVMVHAANPSWWQPDWWWRDADSLRETWTEYLKLVLYLVGMRD